MIRLYWLSNEKINVAKIMKTLIFFVKMSVSNSKRIKVVSAEIFSFHFLLRLSNVPSSFLSPKYIMAFSTSLFFGDMAIYSLQNQGLEELKNSDEAEKANKQIIFQIYRSLLIRLDWKTWIRLQALDFVSIDSQL